VTTGIETTPTPLPRHALVRPDGRRAFVYGELHGCFGGEPEPPPDVAGIHKRLDVLTGSWVAITPARNRRPFDQVAAATEAESCPFCPGGVELPFLYDAAVFENRFPSFVPAPPTTPTLEWPTGPARGHCEVVLYTHRHEGYFGDLHPLELTRVLAVWTDRAATLWDDPAHEYVLVFENRGAEAGATLSHPHGQIYALDHLPPFTAARRDAHRRHRELEGSCLGCRVVAADAGSARIVYANDSVVAAVPFAARWPYEVAVRIRRHGVGRLAQLEPPEQRDLVLALRDVTRRYRALFGFDLLYMMVAQEAPRGEPDWHLSFEFYPLHRAPGQTKIRASVETATGLFLNDVLPEDAAQQLAALEVAAEPIGEGSLLTVVPAEERRVLAPARAR
jgi:UDPglucose--hexose-1-phosphate uridylyltransferase